MKLKFKFPEKKNVDKMYKILKKIYTDDLFGFISEIKHRIFKIKCDRFDSAVVIDPNERRMDIFVGARGLMTCHNMFAGDSASVTAHGFYQFHLLQVKNDELKEFGSAKYFDKYHFYKKDGNTLCYFSSKPGQMPFVCEEDELNTLIEILDYLLHIKSFYDEGEETPLPTEDELVGIFEFNDETMEYDSNFQMLGSFEFAPEMKIRPTFDKKFSESLKSIEIKEGEIHVGIAYGTQALETYEYSNDVFQALQPIYMFACNEEFLDHIVYSSLFKYKNKNLKEQLLNLFNRVGLYDTVITSNPYLYIVLEKNLKPLGIEVILDYEDHLSFTVLMHYSFAADNHATHEETEELMEKLQVTFKEFIAYVMEQSLNVSDMIEGFKESADDDLFDEYDEELEEIDEDMFFETDSKDVC